MIIVTIQATLKVLKRRNLRCVNVEEAENMRVTIGALKYIECSALTQEGLKSVFDEAICAGKVKSDRKKEEKCKLL